jgi:hypothetical protein
MGEDGRRKQSRLLQAVKWTPRRLLAFPTFGTYLQTGTLLLERRVFMLKSRMPPLEYVMNIFYIIGVVVVVLFVASFLGLHA